MITFSLKHLRELVDSRMRKYYAELEKERDYFLKYREEHDSAEKIYAKFEAMINSEAFIDAVVHRINSKQIGGK